MDEEQVNKFWVDRAKRAADRVTHRDIGDIPGIIKAQDIFAWRDDKLVILNPCKPYRPVY